MKFKLMFILLFSFLCAQFDYSKQDLNSSSSSYGEMVWEPTYEGYITLHYFTTQG